RCIPWSRYRRRPNRGSSQCCRPLPAPLLAFTHAERSTLVLNDPAHRTLDIADAVVGSLHLEILDMVVVGFDEPVLHAALLVIDEHDLGLEFLLANLEFRRELVGILLVLPLERGRLNLHVQVGA